MNGHEYWVADVQKPNNGTSRRQRTHFSWAKYTREGARQMAIRAVSNGL